MKRYIRYFNLLPTVLLVYCQKPALYKAKHIFYRMDTVIEVTIVLSKAGFWTKDYKSEVEDTWKKIDSLLMDFEIRFSQTHPQSEVLKINTGSVDPNVIPQGHHVSDILTEMLFTGLSFGDTLDGMFDLTILPIKELWGFGEIDTQKVIPPEDTIKSTLQRVDYRRVKVNAKRNMVLFSDTNTVIDVGGIAKGFALREMGKLLNDLNYNDYLIVAGGDMLAKGRRPDGGAWRIAIKHPRKPDGLLGSFRLDSGSVVTSGDYERYWVSENGKRYHHIFNPGTGYCCTNNQSVTIWCMDPILADVLSTGLFCLPKDSIVAFVENRSDLECVVIDSIGEIAVSIGWEDKITLF